MIEDLILVADSLHSLTAVLASQEPSKSQVAGVIAAVLHEKMTEGLSVLSGHPDSLQESDLAYGTDQKLGSPYTNGKLKEEDHATAHAEEAVSRVLGILHSLQSRGTTLKPNT